MRTTMQYPRREDRHEHCVWHSHEADNSEEKKQVADGKEATDILPAFAELLEDSVATFGRNDGAKTHGEQRGDDGKVADAIDKETPSFAIERDNHAGERRADETR